MAEDSLLALSFNGEPLTMEHGGPQLLLPALYGWKSCKWMVEIQLCELYQPGFWERCGCHPRGRHAFNERFREGLSATIWAWLAAAPGVYRLIGGYSAWVWVMQTGGSALGLILNRFTSLHAAPLPYLDGDGRRITCK
mmetsp:Transcript_18671/g.46485  ORF Transcript_18671/g.46485 Transcript_18671/m.46485 type:complete len:138 (+) Transcript_18671:468-881(+)